MDEFAQLLELLISWAEESETMSLQEAFEQINAVLDPDAFGTFGIEGMTIDKFEQVSSDDAPSMRYINTGDTYSTTLILTDDYVNGEQLIVSTWGGWLEEQEQWVAEEHNMQRCSRCGNWVESNSHYTHCSHCGHESSSADFDDMWEGYAIALAFTAQDESDEDSPGGDIRDVVTVDEVENALGSDLISLKNEVADFLQANFALLRPDDATLRSALLKWGIDHPGQLDTCPDEMSEDDIFDYALQHGLIFEMERVGELFHYNRNGHGIGFWEHNETLNASELDEAATVYGTCELYRYDGTFYINN